METNNGRLSMVLLSAAVAYTSACIGDKTGTVYCGDSLRCPTGSSCAANQLVCISDSCGNGVVEVEANEVCDDGNISDGDGCSGDCRVLENCGDGTIDQYEACDDANAIAGDGCTPDCVSDETCGNGYRDLLETCDDGNNVSGDGCNSDCTVLENCGDGIRDVGEVCDDGGMESGDGCSATCHSTEICGNQIVDTGEFCDTAGATVGCDADCSEVICGDGTLNMAVGESCDEGENDIAINTATCDIDCSFPSCGDSVSNPFAVVAGTAHTEECDMGIDVNSDTEPNTCRTDCTLPRCGDEVVDDADPNLEACDEGVIVNTPTCDRDCSLPECGDGLLNPHHFIPDTGQVEQCDDGMNPMSGNSDQRANACRTTCLLSYCGDKVMDTGEECDGGDGSEPFVPRGAAAIDVDNCDADCTEAVCGDGYLNTANIVNGENWVEQCDDGASNSNTDADACRENCLMAYCGDGVEDASEACDDGENADNDPIDGIAANTSDCDSDCTMPMCGDGLVNPQNPDVAEQCDDGDGSPRDSATCDRDCTVRSCGDSYTNAVAGEQCDDGDSDNTDDCTNECRNAVCGDEIKNGGEACDDTGTGQDDGCSVTTPHCCKPGDPSGCDPCSGCSVINVP